MEITTQRIDRRFGTVRREGPWLVPDRIDVRLTAGNARLDFTEAVARTGTVELAVDLGLGSELTLVVPPGVGVVTEDLDTRHGDYVAHRCADTAPAHLTIRITGRLHGGGDLVVRPPRRNLDQWLRPGRAT
jgi:hypothetical protein